MNVQPAAGMKTWWSDKEQGASLLIIVIATFLVYANSLSNGFVWDDHDLIVNNPLLTSLSGLPRLLISEDSFPGSKTGFYRPVTYVSFLLNRAAGGLNPFRFHLTNLLLHISVAICLYCFIRLVFKNGRAALMAALIFALHPANSEPVNFLSARNTLLASLFMLLSFIMHIRQRRVPAVVFFVLSIFSKEYGILLPLLFALYDRVVAAEAPSHKGRLVLTRYVPYGSAIIVYLALRSVAVGGSGIELDGEHFINRLMLVPELVLTYIRNFLFPFWLKLPYVIRFPETFTLKVAVTTAGFLLLVGLLYACRRSAFVLFSLFWFLLFLLPVLNIIPLGDIIMADRYAYIPYMGLCMITAHLFMHIRSAARNIVVVLLCVLFSVMIIHRNPAWNNSFSLYASMVKSSPDSNIAHHNLGMHWYTRGDLEKARESLENAVSGYPRRENSRFYLGVVYWELGNADKALLLFQEAVSIAPDAKAYFMMGRVYEEKGDREAAQTFYKQARNTMPDIDMMRKGSAEMMCADAEKALSENDLDRAEKIFRRALRYEPSFARALIGVGNVTGERGDLDGAIRYFQRALAYEPSNPIPHYNLSIAYRFKGMFDRADAEMKSYRKLGGIPQSNTSP